MSGHIPNVNDPDPCEPPPPYSVVADPDTHDKAGVYPSAPGWAYPPPPPDISQEAHGQLGGYPMQPGYPSQQGYPQAAYSSPPAFSSLQPGPYSASPPSSYGTSYAQQPGAYVAGPQTTTVIMQQPLLASVVQPFRDLPMQTVCPKCQAPVVTVTVHENGTLTWLLCAILCLIGCDGGCCLIPFCVDSCKDVVHVCPNCRQLISRYHRL